ncbi:FCA [Symbiodinium sp. KB8]|nr:FCA [Symbiodinium sp. KB8]
MCVCFGPRLHQGGVKLFVGRLPREVNKTQLEECFGEFGEVLEVFIIASQAASGVGCAFVRMASIPAAEEAIADLHEQRVLIPEQADLGPMQVAFAKGEAIRLGLDEKEEILPSFKEARQKVVEHQEKKHFFEKMQKQQEEQAKIVEYQHALMMQHQAMLQQIQEKPREDLVTIVKDGQRNGGQPFKQRWWSFCDAGWSGCRDYDPNHHGKEALAHFVSVASTEYGHEQWFKSRFPKLPALPEKPKGMPEPGSPGMMPPGAPPPGPGPPHRPPHGPPGPPGPPGGLGPRPPMAMGPGGPIPPGPPGLPPHLPPHLPPMPGMPGMPPGMPGPPFGPPGVPLLPGMPPPFPLMHPPPGSEIPAGDGGGGRPRRLEGTAIGAKTLAKAGPGGGNAGTQASSDSSDSEDEDIGAINADDI